MPQKIKEKLIVILYKIWKEERKIVLTSDDIMKSKYLI